MKFFSYPNLLLIADNIQLSFTINNFLNIIPDKNTQNNNYKTNFLFLYSKSIFMDKLGLSFFIAG